MQVLNSSVARPWKLEQNTSGQASRQALRASRLWKLEQNNMTKKGPFFGACPDVFCSNFHGLATLEFKTCIEACLQLCFILYFFWFAAISITLRP